MQIVIYLNESGLLKVELNGSDRADRARTRMLYCALQPHLQELHERVRALTLQAECEHSRNTHDAHDK